MLLMSICLRALQGAQGSSESTSSKLDDLKNHESLFGFPIAPWQWLLAASVLRRLHAPIVLLFGWLVAAVAPLGITAPAQRVPHVAGLRMPGGLSPELPARLAAQGIHVAARGGVLRVSPHGYNDAADIDRLTAALATP
jgi:hypothetical protein